MIFELFLCGTVKSIFLVMIGNSEIGLVKFIFLIIISVKQCQLDLSFRNPKNALKPLPLPQFI